MMYLSFVIPKKANDARNLLSDAVARYIEKFGEDPQEVLVNPRDAASRGLTVTGLPVVISTVAPQGTIYVGAAEWHTDAAVLTS